MKNHYLLITDHVSKNKICSILHDLNIEDSRIRWECHNCKIYFMLHIFQTDVSDFFSDSCYQTENYT